VPDTFFLAFAFFLVAMPFLTDLAAFFLLADAASVVATCAGVAWAAVGRVVTVLPVLDFVATELDAASVCLRFE
jgi:hypothetical protein